MYSTSFINNVFTKASTKYDLMNDAISLGMHRIWKKKLCSLVQIPNAKILDVATGSGDIAFLLRQKAIKQFHNIDITGIDVNPSMLMLAKKRKLKENIIDNINFIEADATNLPFGKNLFDYYIISFGIRNIPDISKALDEAYRVLKPNGKFLCLEFSKPYLPFIRETYQFYSDNIIPKIGKIIANNSEGYEYLVESIKNFPDQNKFLNMMRNAGFKISYAQNLTFSIASIYVGLKP